jgi:malate synthase
VSDEDVLTGDAMAFLGRLHGEFAGRREELLGRRAERRERLRAGERLDFRSDSQAIRDGDWRVPEAPPPLQDRRVEITGPTDRKMVINALNSGARGFMADFEDANSPTWSNMIEGQRNLTDAIERTISFSNPDGREYTLNDEVATLIVRPRGWHLPERHIDFGGREAVGALVDFGLYFFRNAARLLARGSGPFFYLPKLESAHEAALWHDVFCLAEDELGLDRGTIRATVLIETAPAAFEMDEILHALGEHATALNAGRWDYIFSMIKCHAERPEFVLPDRAQVTMTVPFMRAYTELLVKTCHRRGAHAMGGMAALIPSRKDAEANERAVDGVRADKRREAGDGFDGTWVAHPDLVPVAQAEFDAVLAGRPNQLERQRDDVAVTADDLLSVEATPGEPTEDGLAGNVSVAVRYIAAWLEGNGAVALNNLMEDAATAEIARTQIWQWRRHGTEIGGEPVTPERVRGLEPGCPEAAIEVFEAVALAEQLPEFLTLAGYPLLVDEAG